MPDIIKFKNKIYIDIAIIQTLIMGFAAVVALIGTVIYIVSVKTILSITCTPVFIIRHTIKPKEVKKRLPMTEGIHVHTLVVANLVICAVASGDP